MIFCNVTVHNEQELDLLLKTHPAIAALPTDPQARKELHQLAPKSKKYVFIMMDSGASINAGWAKKHFPGSVVRTSPGQLKGEFANTASGDRLLQCHTSKSESKLTKYRLGKRVPVANTEQEFPHGSGWCRSIVSADCFK